MTKMRTNMTTMKTALSGALMSLSLLGSGAVLAHSGAEPKHGGIVQTASDLSFELVARPDGAVIYVEDHGKPMSVDGMSGKLTVLQGSERSEAALKASGDKFEASGIRLAPGAKVVAALQSANRKAITVRFTVK